MTEFTLHVRSVLMVVCLVIFVLVFAWMVVSAWKHHHGGGREDSNFHGSVAVEVSWALAPVVIVMLLVWPTVRSVFQP